MEHNSEAPRIKIISTTITPIGASNTKEQDMNYEYSRDQYQAELRELHDETDMEWSEIQAMGYDTYEGWVLVQTIMTSDNEEIITALQAWNNRDAA